MAGSSQPQHFFAAGYVFANFGALCIDPSPLPREMIFLKIQIFSHQDSKDPRIENNHVC